MGRPTNIDARRGQLADALLHLLATGAFADIKVADIARAAGLGTGLVHHHFDSKDEVLAVAVERLAIRLELRLTERLRDVGDEPRARIGAFIDSWLALGGDAEPRAALAWAAIGDEARRRPEVRTLYAAALERACERLASELAAALPRTRRRRALPLARTIVVAIEGALRVGAGGGLPVGAAAPLVRQLATALLQAEGDEA